MHWTIAALLALVLAGGVASLTGGVLGAVSQGVNQVLLGGARLTLTRVHRLMPTVTPPPGPPPGLVLGYLADPASDPGAVALLQSYHRVINGIIPFWYTISADGTVTGSTNTSVLDYAHQQHWYTLALVRNMAGASVFGPLLASPAARARAIAQMLTLVEKYGYSGVNLDWEGIAPSDRNAFSAFVRTLASVFHAHHYDVTLSIPAETADEPNNGWTGAYNYQALGRSADLLILMAYDQHNASSGAGPIAASSWVRAVLSYAIATVAPEKIVLGIPGYGYDWSAAGTMALTWQQAEDLAVQYHQATGGGHFTYVAGGRVHTVWFENASALLKNLMLAAGFEVRGMALWRLGIEDPKLWALIQR
ncbi:MAG: glycosyl hydrolase family 18 protein [Firmicutes bacterium]|nr:glycosyl hydrolase family 18 protein [Bacillota bacterium]